MNGVQIDDDDDREEDVLLLWPLLVTVEAAVVEAGMTVAGASVLVFGLPFLLLLLDIIVKNPRQAQRTPAHQVL